MEVKLCEAKFNVKLSRKRRKITGATDKSEIKTEKQILKINGVNVKLYFL